MKKSLEEIARRDGRYDYHAIKFVYEGLGHSVRKTVDESEEIDGLSQPQHVSGQELCRALRELAIEKWGRLAKVVLEKWGVKNTRDFGEIVYLMINQKWMSRQTGDAIEDFDNVYDFKTVFEDRFPFDLKTQ